MKKKRLQLFKGCVRRLRIILRFLTGKETGHDTLVTLSVPGDIRDPFLVIELNPWIFSSNLLLIFRSCYLLLLSLSYCSIIYFFCINFFLERVFLMKSFCVYSYNGLFIRLSQTLLEDRRWESSSLSSSLCSRRSITGLIINWKYSMYNDCFSWDASQTCNVHVKQTNKKKNTKIVASSNLIASWLPTWHFSARMRYYVPRHRRRRNHHHYLYYICSTLVTLDFSIQASQGVPMDFTKVVIGKKKTYVHN